jgi:Spy/CpxP family protein refolding chaperone
MINGVAKTVSVVVSDDIDGSPNAETVTFGLDGITYEIDLGKKNKAKLERDFAPYVHAGRRMSRVRGRVATSQSGAPRVDRAAVRAWANEHGLEVSERGRISAVVMKEYEAAN